METTERAIGFQDPGSRWVTIPEAVRTLVEDLEQDLRAITYHGEDEAYAQVRQLEQAARDLKTMAELFRSQAEAASGRRIIW